MENGLTVPVKLLTTSRAVSDLADKLSRIRCVAVDTESNSRHRYPERVCLVQLATEVGSYLIDTLAVDDMKPIGEILADRTVAKVIQGAEYDIRCLDREWGFRVRNIFDTSIAARFVGMSQIGLSALAEALIGVHIPKDPKIQKGDWSRRPLTQEEVSYAATDVWYLLDIQRALERRLRAIGRSQWVSEECARLEEIRYVAPDPTTAYLSLKGSRSLDGQGRAILKRLFMAREVEALRRNRPPYYVVRHETLIYLAGNPDTDLNKFPPLQRLSESQFGRHLRTAFRMGLADPPINNPIRKGVDSINSVETRRLSALKQWRLNLGNELRIDPALVWPVASLKRLAKAPDTLNAELRSPDVRQWQRERFGASLTASLA